MVRLFNVAPWWKNRYKLANITGRTANHVATPSSSLLPIFGKTSLIDQRLNLDRLTKSANPLLTKAPRSAKDNAQSISKSFAKWCFLLLTRYSYFHFIDLTSSRFNADFGCGVSLTDVPFAARFKNWHCFLRIDSRFQRNETGTQLLVFEHSPINSGLFCIWNQPFLLACYDIFRRPLQNCDKKNPAGIRRGFYGGGGNWTLVPRKR